MGRQNLLRKASKSCKFVEKKKNIYTNIVVQAFGDRDATGHSNRRLAIKNPEQLLQKRAELTSPEELFLRLLVQ